MSGHPGISWDVKGHLRPGTLGIVLGGTSQDIPGYSEAVHYILVYLGHLGKSVAVLDICAKVPFFVFLDTTFVQ